jgi:hypothetical protein
MRLRSLNLRTYLIFSYLALILLLTVGMWFIDDYYMHRLAQSTLALENRGAQNLTNANLQLSESMIRSLGEYIVKDKAEDVARELAHFFKGEKSYNYEQIRQDP